MTPKSLHKIVYFTFLYIILALNVKRESRICALRGFHDSKQGSHFLLYFVFTCFCLMSSTLNCPVKVCIKHNLFFKNSLLGGTKLKLFLRRLGKVSCGPAKIKKYITIHSLLLLVVYALRRVILQWLHQMEQSTFNVNSWLHEQITLVLGKIIKHEC